MSTEVKEITPEQIMQIKLYATLRVKFAPLANPKSCMDSRFPVGVVGNKIISQMDEDFDSIEECDDISNSQNDFRPLLRPLESMTPVEVKHILKKHTMRSLNMGKSEKDFAIEICKRLSEQGWLLLYLMGQGFDLFGLIDAGQAIDKTSLIK